MKKDLIAKLLAQENLTIIRTDADTASFDVKNRILRLPLWDDITNNEELLLKLHEVGHALFTPCDMDPDHQKFWSAINVVEDARIERMIKNKYRGAAHTMKLGYSSLVEKDFFGINDNDDLSELNILDRLNLHFKIGDVVDIELNDLEKSYVKRIEVADDYSDIVYIAHELFGLAKDQNDEKKQEQEQEQNKLSENGENSDNSEAGNNKSSPFIDEDSNSTDEDSNSMDDTDDENSEVNENVYSQFGDDSEELLSTQSNFNNKLKDTLSGGQIKSVFIASKHNWKDKFVSYKEFYKDIPTYYEDDEQFRFKFSKLMATSKKSVSYLTSEFNRKKSAKEYQKSYSSKTGDLDVSKIWQHKFSDDIFKTTTISPTGKNHGFVMYIDWSGSMADKIIDTIEQTIQLAQFARKIHQPFEVIAFTNRWDGDFAEDHKPANESITIGELHETSGQRKLSMLQILSSSMSNSEFNTSIKKLYFLIHSVANSWKIDRWYGMPSKYGLGSTPLNSVLVYGLTFTENFIKNKRIEKLNVIVLTDGDDTSSFDTIKNDVTDNDEDSYSYSRDDSMTGWSKNPGCNEVTDSKTKKTYKVGSKNRWGDDRVNSSDLTSAFLKMYKDRFNASVTGIFIGSRGDINYKLNELVGHEKALEIKKTITKFGYASVPTEGYDANFLIVSTNNKHEIGEMQKPKKNKSGNITKTAYANTFKKSLNSKATNKNMLREMSSVIA